MSNQAAVQSAIRHHYYQPTHSVIGRPVVHQAGPVFAAVVPLTYTIETQAPEAGLHIREATTMTLLRLELRSGSLARSELVYEHERRPILGIELAQMAPDENVLLPAFADFSGCSEEETWAFARRLLTEELPAEATRATFVG